MGQPLLQVGEHGLMARADLAALFQALQRRGYQIIGPTIREDAIVYDEISSPDDLPAGWTDEQDAGQYRLRRRSDAALFGYAVGPRSWKHFLHPPVRRLWKAQRDGDDVRFDPAATPAKLAFFGARACDLHAIAIQDTIMTGGPYVDAFYQAQRQHIFVVAVGCAHAAGTCFCVSMGTGPRPTKGFDLALTEVVQPGRHVFVVEVGTEAGAAVLTETPVQVASAEDVDAAEQVVAATAAHMGRSMDTSGIRALLYANLEHPRWDDVAQRCLTCGNCTMVCPTCFCFKVEQATDLTGDLVESVRRMDVCFTTEFTYTAGRPQRASARSRYRQWLTHKVGSWIDQFGMSGCVGCGRCITWCPVGIDITEEVAAIRASSDARKAG